MENTETKEVETMNENEDQNDMSLTRPSLGSDADYDDDLEVSDSIQIVDMGDGPVAIENSEDEIESKLWYSLNFYNHTHLVWKYHDIKVI